MNGLDEIAEIAGRKESPNVSGWGDVLVNSALGPLAWAPNAASPTIPTATEAVKKAASSVTPADVADAALGPGGWGAKAVEQAAARVEETSPTAAAVKDTAKTIRYATYAGAALAGLAVIGYAASGLGKLFRG